MDYVLCHTEKRIAIFMNYWFQHKYPVALQSDLDSVKNSTETGSKYDPVIHW